MLYNPIQVQSLGSFSWWGRAFFILPLLLGLSACVSATKHKELGEEFEISQKLLEKTEENLQASEERVGELEVLVAQLQQQLGRASDDQESLRASITQMREALAEMSQRKREVEKRVAEFRDLLNRFRALTDTGQLSVRIVEGRMVVVMPGDVLFASGSAQLSTEGEERVRQVGRVLAELPDKRFQVEGHTDNVPIRTAQFPSNWELASARALTVVRAMLSEGLAAEQLSAASFAETQPVQSNEDEEGRAANRRIEIVVVPDLSTLPGYEELQRLSEEQELSGL